MVNTVRVTLSWLIGAGAFSEQAMIDLDDGNDALAKADFWDSGEWNYLDNAEIEKETYELVYEPVSHA